MERLASCPSPHLLSICHPERSRRDPLRGGNPAAPNFRPLYLVILSEVRRRPNEVKDLCTPTYPFNCLKRDSSYRANSVMRGRASPTLSLACHPERSEAAAERSRKLALSEVEGPLVWSHSPSANRHFRPMLLDKACARLQRHPERSEGDAFSREKARKATITPTATDASSHTARSPARAATSAQYRPTHSARSDARSHRLQSSPRTQNRHKPFSLRDQRSDDIPRAP